MAKFNPDDCKYCNNTDGVCCDNAPLTDSKVQAHIISASDEYAHKRADKHCQMTQGILYGALVSTQERVK